MSWNTDAEVQDKLELAKRLITQYGETLTFEQAEESVLSDTIELAHWSGLKDRALSPCQALLELKGLKRKPN